jgi:hypothetical protein
VIYPDSILNNQLYLAGCPIRLATAYITTAYASDIMYIYFCYNSGDEQYDWLITSRAWQYLTYVRMSQAMHTMVTVAQVCLEACQHMVCECINHGQPITDHYIEPFHHQTNQPCPRQQTVRLPAVEH